MLYRLYLPDNVVTKHDVTVTPGWQDSSVAYYCSLSHTRGHVDWSVIVSFSGHTFITPGRRQSKRLLSIIERGSKIGRNSVFDCHLSPVGRQMAIEKFVSNDFLSMFVDSIDVFDCRLPGVFTLLLFPFLPNRPRVVEQLICINANAFRYMLHCKAFATRGERRI